MKKEKESVLEENLKIKEDMAKQQKEIDRFKNDFNRKRERLEKTVNEMNDIQKRK